MCLPCCCTAVCARIQTTLPIQGRHFNLSTDYGISSFKKTALQKDNVEDFAKYYIPLYPNLHTNYEDEEGEAFIAKAIALKVPAKKIVGFLLDTHRVDMENLGGNTPLHLAAMSDDCERFIALWNNGAKLDTTNDRGYTAYGEARIAKAKKIVQLFNEDFFS